MYKFKVADYICVVLENPTYSFWDGESYVSEAVAQVVQPYMDTLYVMFIKTGCHGFVLTKESFPISEELYTALV